MTIRYINKSDTEILYNWRNNSAIRRYMFNSTPLTQKEHINWLNNIGKKKKFHALIYENDDNIKSGFFSFQLKNTERGIVAEWGFYKAPNAPRGIGTLMCNEAINYAFNELYSDIIIGRVLKINDKSITFHRKLGFKSSISKDKSTDQYCFELHKRWWNNSYPNS
jgi:UDP-4-amino-4,6-dideoxy-N-acetyl-beta-L-altrosamine N-acetyltransferase